MNFSWNDSSLPINPLQYLEHQTLAGIYLLDVTTNKMVWSSGVYTLLGLEPGEVEPSRQAVRELVHPMDRRPIDEMDRTFSSGNPFHIQHRIITRDRRVRWISNHGEFLFDQAGKPTTVIGVFQDISAAQRSQALIADYSQRLDALLELTNSVAWTANPDGEITSVSGWQSAFLTPEEPLGMKMFELVHPDEREASINARKTAMANGERINRKHRILHPDGTYHLQSCKAIPVKSSDGTIKEWIGVTFDLTDEPNTLSFRKIEDIATGSQIRAARSILRLSVRDLSELSGVSIGVIRRLEEIDGFASDRDDKDASARLRTQLEKRGLTFIFPVGLKPAVCPS